MAKRLLSDSILPVTCDYNPVKKLFRFVLFRPDIPARALPSSFPLDAHHESAYYFSGIRSTENSNDCLKNSSGKGGNGLDAWIARTAACLNGKEPFECASSNWTAITQPDLLTLNMTVAFASFISSGGFQFCLIFSRTLSRYQAYLKSCCDVTATPSLCFPAAGDPAPEGAGAVGDSLGTVSFAFVCSKGAGFCFSCPRPGNASFFGTDFLSSTAAFFGIGDGCALSGIVSFFVGAGAAAGVGADSFGCPTSFT